MYLQVEKTFGFYDSSEFLYHEIFFLLSLFDFLLEWALLSALYVGVDACYNIFFAGKSKVTKKSRSQGTPLEVAVQCLEIILEYILLRTFVCNPSILLEITLCVLLDHGKWFILQTN